MKKNFSCHFEVKALEKNDDGSIGRVYGMASTFGNKDRDGDVIEKGAFIKTMLDRQSLGKSRIPMLWQHDMREPIGGFPLSNMKETEAGLEVMGEINLETAKGKDAYALLKSGDLSDFSIGFVIKDQEFKSGSRYIKEIDLWEISLVTIPANAEAQVTGVKSASTVKFCNRDMAEDSKESWAEHCGGVDTVKYADGFMNGVQFKAIEDGCEVIKWRSVLELTAKYLVEGQHNEVIEKLFSEKELPSPFRNGGTVDLQVLKAARQSEAEKFLRAGLRFSRSAAKKLLSSREDCVDSNSGGDHDKKSLLNQLNELKTVLEGK